MASRGGGGCAAALQQAVLECAHSVLDMGDGDDKVAFDDKAPAKPTCQIVGQAIVAFELDAERFLLVEGANHAGRLPPGALPQVLDRLKSHPVDIVKVDSRAPEGTVTNAHAVVIESDGGKRTVRVQGKSEGDRE